MSFVSGRLTNANTLRGRPRYHMLLENSNVTFTLANPDESIHFRPAVDMLGHPVPIKFMINRSLCNSEKRGCRVQLTISQKVVNRQGLHNDQISLHFEYSLNPEDVMFYFFQGTVCTSPVAKCSEKFEFVGR